MTGKIIQKEHSKENPIDNSDIDFDKADALTDEEIEERAKNDPDSLPFTEEQLRKIKIRRRNKKDEQKIIKNYIKGSSVTVKISF